jgi:hypothetical protein
MHPRLLRPQAVARMPFKNMPACGDYQTAAENFAMQYRGREIIRLSD